MIQQPLLSDNVFLSLVAAINDDIYPKCFSDTEYVFGKVQKLLRRYRRYDDSVKIKHFHLLVKNIITKSGRYVHQNRRKSTIYIEEMTAFLLINLVLIISCHH